MAKLVAFDQFDINTVDLNWYFENTYDAYLTKNAQVQVNGVTYADVYYVNGYDGFDDLELYFLGSGMTEDALGRVVSGTVNFVAEAEYDSSGFLWYAEGISISAVSLYDAAATPSNADEFALIVSALSGDDTIILSSFADRMSGFAGNDTITGGLGRDILEGGSGNDTFRDTKAGLSGDVLLDFTFGDRIVITDATLSSFSFNITGSTLNYTGGSLTFGSAPSGILLASAAAGGGVQLVLSKQFASSGNVLVSNFAVGAGGWSSQDSYPRHVADVNGDGYSDIVGFGQAGVVASFGSANGSFSAASLVSSDFGQSAGWSSDNAFHRELADVNGDRRADIIGFGTAGTLVSLARADGTFAAPVVGAQNFGTAQGWTSQESHARVVGDVNGDGKADLIGFGSAGTLVALGNGDGTFGVAALALANFGVQQGWTSDNAFHRVVADVNGDKKDDIIGFGAAGTWVALSKGDGTFQAPQLALSNFGKDQGWSTQNGFARDVADVNGDGRADIVGFGIAGTYVAYGSASGTFTSATLDVENFGGNQGWTSDNIFHRELADINNDGRIDIVGFGQAGVLAGLNQAHWMF
ncbi:FG-GAP-like repeat-containing protein [Sphingomonas glaciei]|uniref:FG-GAP-like repeat-containing protein n=1 Tax=Sphingomonas glaciei TaxID=2938948 RepID=A0ABY5MZR0_9SPHN|nr:FG-GAP-like repeat-containing protein [Sphingomonas glaciei]UUR07846.1 FG-GAP-like repeat-containing protein [Sphingomonas glaciei]